MRWVLLALFIVFIFLSVWWDMSLILLGFGCGAIVVLYGGQLLHWYFLVKKKNWEQAGNYQRDCFQFWLIISFLLYLSSFFKCFME